MTHPMHYIKRLPQLTILTSVLALAACGGSGGSGGAKSLGGIAVDGYLQGATVFLDLNRNNTLDAGEPSTTTDASGRYTLDYSTVTGGITGLPVVITGGIDSDTGFAFTGKLSAPADTATSAQVVTPLTTLVDALIAQGLASNATAAKQMVASALGLTVDQLATDPVAAIANNPGIYTTTVALQRAILMLASANARPGESVHETQERVIRALATAISSQTSAIDIGQLLASLNLQNTTQARELASAILQSVRTGLNSAGHSGAKSALKAMDEIRTRMQSDDNYDLASAANRIDTERGRTTSRPYYQLTQNSSSTTALNVIRNLNPTTTTLMQPANTTGRLLASNCFQCHGTGGVGGFDTIRGGNAAEIRDYLSQAPNSSIMAAHAQGYTTAQLNALIAYLQQ